MPRRKHDIPKPRYGKAFASGLEAIIRPVIGQRGTVHKIFFPDWITRKYLMGGRLSWISRQAFSPVMAEIRDVQPPPRGRHGFQTLPAEQWKKITFILATHTVYVLKAARKLGIPTPNVFRQVCVMGKTGLFWVVEMSDLRKKGAVIVSGDELEEFHKEKKIANFGQLKKQILADERKMARAGFHHDFSHRRFGQWVVRIDKKTRIGERFIVDATNFRTG